ncbi:hypothetical protein BASA60_001866 [Batrachochytrium salamandrivorans]|nr:hypothetical protein BASA60_001866 [Batrachochytrium salamandrivorans]KAH9272017.1 hypothetical protein BASA83_005863 [Batrachochytrium salamandrivorans]
MRSQWLVSLLGLFITILALAVTKPDEASFHRSVATQYRGPDNPILSIFSLSSLVKAATARLLRYDDYGLFATMTLSHGKYGYSPLRSLGLLNTWVDASNLRVLDRLPSPSFVSDWFNQIRRSCPRCLKGVCLPLSLSPPSASCVCIPSHKGMRCDRPLRNTVTIWDEYITPVLMLIANQYPHLAPAIAAWSHEPTVFGVPAASIPFAGRRTLDYLNTMGLINLSQYISVVDILFFAMLGVYLLWKFVALSNLSGLETFMVGLFTSSWDQAVGQLRLYSMITSQLSHMSVVHLLVNLYGFKVCAPDVYEMVGHVGFMRLVGFSMVLSAIGSVVYVWTTQGHRVGWRLVQISGSNGWIMALRVVLALRHYKSGYAIWGSGMSGIDIGTLLLRLDWGGMWALVGPQLVMDFVLGGNLGADLGGAIGAILCVVGLI